MMMMMITVLELSADLLFTRQLRENQSTTLYVNVTVDTLSLILN